MTVCLKTHEVQISLVVKVLALKSDGNGIKSHPRQILGEYFLNVILKFKVPNYSNVLINLKRFVVFNAISDMLHILLSCFLKLCLLCIINVSNVLCST